MFSVNLASHSPKFLHFKLCAVWFKLLSSSMFVQWFVMCPPPQLEQYGYLQNMEHFSCLFLTHFNYGVIVWDVNQLLWIAWTWAPLAEWWMTGNIDITECLSDPSHLWSTVRSPHSTCPVPGTCVRFLSFLRTFFLLVPYANCINTLCLSM